MAAPRVATLASASPTNTTRRSTTYTPRIPRARAAAAPPRAAVRMKSAANISATGLSHHEGAASGHLRHRARHAVELAQRLLAQDDLRRSRHDAIRLQEEDGGGHVQE